jgi:electron transfer flavoprotein alpha subunit
MSEMFAVVVARAGDLPLGAADVFAECGAAGVVVDVDGLRPGALAAALVERVAGATVVVLPASPDGRDLAPRLAAELGRPLLAGAVRLAPGRAVLARRGGSVLEERRVDGPYVATLEPGVRGIPADLAIPDPTPLPTAMLDSDPEVIEVTAPDASELDLVEATRILGVGAGLGDARYVELAGRIADALGMSLGATRVVTDWGWLPFERQIGTTGAMVDPEIYVAIAISGAVQHVSGLGEPELVVSVNTDGSCPMSSMAEINLVSDGPAVLVALADRLDLDVDADLRPTDPERTDG